MADTTESPFFVMSADCTARTSVLVRALKRRDRACGRCDAMQRRELGVRVAAVAMFLVCAKEGSLESSDVIVQLV